MNFTFYISNQFFALKAQGNTAWGNAPGRSSKRLCALKGRRELDMQWGLKLMRKSSAPSGRIVFDGPDSQGAALG